MPSSISPAPDILGGMLRAVFFLGVIAFSSKVTKAVTLAEAYEAALAKTEAVPTAQVQITQAEERLSAGVGRVLPNIQFLASYTRQDTPSTLNAFTRPDQSGARFTLTQPLFQGFGEWAELRSRKLLVEAGREGEKEARLNVYTSVAQNYYEVLAAERDRQNLENLLALSQKRTREIEQRVRIGRSRQGELLSAQAQLASLQSQLDAAQGAVEQARETFSLATGLSPATPVTEPAQALPPAPASLETLLSKVTSRPDLKAAQHRVEAAQQSVRVAQAAHFPSLDLTANYYLKRTGILQDTRWDVTFQLTVPLFQGGAVQATVREQAARHKEAELQSRLLQRQALRDARALWTQLKSQLDQYRSLEKALSAAEQNYREQAKDYGYGLVTNLEVLQAMNTYQDTRRSVDRTRYQAWATAARLNAVAGEVVF